MERRAAIEALGLLKAVETLPFLSSLLTICAQSLDDKSVAVGLPEADGYELDLASEILQALARLDCFESHELLLRTCLKRGDRFLRAAAISATGLEANWHDPLLVRQFLNFRRDQVFRIAAVNAVHHCSGLRLAQYKPFIVPLLDDPSPCVVTSAVEVLALLWARDDKIADLLNKLLNDTRYCKIHHTTISKFVAGYYD
jgi:HEAT repeat protein